jgi:hypothetical protein
VQTDTAQDPIAWIAASVHNIILLNCAVRFMLMEATRDAQRSQFSSQSFSQNPRMSRRKYVHALWQS